MELPVKRPDAEWVMVPTEPTPEMLSRYDEARLATTTIAGGVATYNPHQSYWAMLAAAPEHAPVVASAQDHPFGFALPEMDVEAFLNARDWLTKAVESAGAKFIGGGVGMGQADIDVEMDGCRYNISIRPLPK